ncbi:MAG: hypothetical protein U9R19_15450 [Bacteroidota bacterium]|nr:hypothetical protein [Bacteroidota bacterium]
MKREIGFSKIQIDSFRYSKKMHIEKMQDLNSELHKMKKQLMDGAFDESFTTENANKLIREIGNVQIEIEQAGHNHLLEMKRICGDGQQEKLENLLKEAMIRHKPKFHKHKRPPAYDKFHNRKRQPPDGSKQPSD